MFALLCVIFGFPVVVDFLIMCLSSKDDTPAGTPTPRHTFLQLGFLAQQLRT